MVESELGNGSLFLLVSDIHIDQESGACPVTLLVLVQVQADLTTHWEWQTLVGWVADHGFQSHDALRQLDGDSRLGI